MGRKKIDPTTSYFGDYPLMKELEKAHFVLKLRDPRLKWTLRNLGMDINRNIRSTVMDTTRALTTNLDMKELREMNADERRKHVEWFLNTVMDEVNAKMEDVIEESVEETEAWLGIDRVEAGYEAPRD
jgi:hypothetical protein